MGGFIYGGCLPLKVDDNKKNVLENGGMGMASYPFQVPQIFLQGYGERCIPQTCSSWSGDGVVLVRDNILTEYMQLDFTEALMKDRNGNISWRNMCHLFADDSSEDEDLYEYRDAQRHLVTEYDLKTLTAKRYKVVLDECTKFDELDFCRVGEFLDGRIIDNHYVVNNGVLKRCIGTPCDLAIPDSVVKIDEAVFDEDHHYRSILIPENLVDISDAFFKHCSTECVSVADGNPRYYVKNGCLIDRYTSALIWGYSESGIPDDGTVTRLGANALSNCRRIKRIVIPDAITEIDPSAFDYCYYLKEFSMPDALVGQVESIFGKQLVKVGDVWKFVEYKMVFQGPYF
jgi:hypothetical protein